MRLLSVLWLLNLLAGVAVVSVPADAPGLSRTTGDIPVPQPPLPSPPRA